MASAGRLIAVEGGEGAGKSTQAGRLARVLGAELSREPGGTDLGERIRALLLDPGAGEVSARAELLLMLAARSQHLEERIEPALAAGRHVVVDRFTGSTVAYQGYGRGLPLDEVLQACELASRGRSADLNVLLDVPVHLGESRAGPSRDRIEAANEGFHERVRAGFAAQAAADPGRWCVVDGSGPPAEVAAAVLEAVRARLGLAPVPVTQ